jgi:hypothetical protein
MIISQIQNFVQLVRYIIISLHYNIYSVHILVQYVSTT